MAEQPDSPLLTALITWLPFLILIFIWAVFMRRLSGKGGYGEYMRTTRERIERIETHLADIASSLHRIADSVERRP